MFLQGIFLGLIQTNDLFNLFVFLELMTVLITILIAYKKTGPSFRAGIYYLLLNTVGAMFFLIGIIMIYYVYGTINIQYLIQNIDLHSDESLIKLAFIMMMSGISIKAAFFPLFTWLPKAHGVAQSSISALLSGLAVKGALYMFIRIYLEMFSKANYNMSEFFFYLGATTAIVGVTFALTQKDLKQVLAYHTVSQIGIMMMGLSSASDLSYVGGLMHILNHALFKSLLFLGAGLVIYGYQTKKIYEIRGVFKSMPWTSILLIIGMLAISGAPLFNGFVSKTLVKYDFKNDLFKMALFTIINIGTVTSFIKFSQILYGPKVDVIKRKDFTQILGMTILGFGCIAIGIFYIPFGQLVFVKDLNYCSDIINIEFEKAQKAFEEITLNERFENLNPEKLFLTKDTFLSDVSKFSIIEFGRKSISKNEIFFNTKPQPYFNKNFDLILSDFSQNIENGIENLVFSDNSKQFNRIEDIFNDINLKKNQIENIFTPIKAAIHEGFISSDLNIALYTDHQLFERHHRFRLKEGYARKEALTVKDIVNLCPGDFVTHIDHGVGRFDGLEKIDINGKSQEAIRLIYKDNDILYVSIHCLHRINKYTGKEGSAPSLHRLGSGVWNKLKEKTKNKVKEIAIDLIRLYAERKMKKGFAFSPDNYLQNELEASFIYEDTPDQMKSTIDVKKDMEAFNPMDRLICGDVGFGKTEIAIRAAFKAVCDSKQVAILVPTTILALQHYKTFSERIKNLPCNVDYINRFKTTKQQKETLENLESGKIDIIIGTHRILSKDVKFKDLGLLIIDEEQKFGVAAKEKMREMKINIDTLTLTATPIPRTLQFSLMGARDLSIINTPPPNRQPIKTEIIDFSEDVIKEAISYELNRGGQIFFIHNRVQNINEIKDFISKIHPKARVSIGHGQMEGEKLEEIMLDFIEGNTDILIATTIIESGLDITNANTIIINNAQNFGLSDLHQMRGRVGRSNKKAFCYLIAPPSSMLTDEANKRLKAIEDFSDLGSGFNIAMRDLDIRGAGNILGGEQSGFINEMGYDTYLKILQESIAELKENEFKDLFKEENQKKDYVSDCIFESDLEIHIPDEYVNESSERINLYRAIDNLSNEEALVKFEKDLNDRFGATPPQTQDLLNTIRLRWIAKELGFEKIILKNNKLVAYLIPNEDSQYYQSIHFTKIIEYIKYNYNICKMQNQNNKATLTFKNASSVSEALSLLTKIIDTKV